MLKVPAWAAWSHLPDVDPEEIAGWVQYIETEQNQNNPFARYMREVVKADGTSQDPKDAPKTEDSE
jgi:hypothetical protein